MRVLRGLPAAAARGKIARAAVEACGRKIAYETAGVVVTERGRAMPSSARAPRFSISQISTFAAAFEDDLDARAVVVEGLRTLAGEAGWDGLYDLEVFSDNGTFGSAHEGSLWDVPAGELARRGRAAMVAAWESRPRLAASTPTQRQEEG